jgi:hypothetical protein
MEIIGGDLRQMQRTPLAASHVQALRAEGKIATYPAGTFLARPGEPIDRFVHVEEGEIEVVNPSRPARTPLNISVSPQVRRRVSDLGGSVFRRKVWRYVPHRARNVLIFLADRGDIVKSALCRTDIRQLRDDPEGKILGG